MVGRQDEDDDVGMRDSQPRRQGKNDGIAASLSQLFLTFHSHLFSSSKKATRL